MGYAFYTLPDGREAGYGVEATCDVDGCGATIDRGLAYLCGEQPDGWRDADEPGCGRYFCGAHEGHHDCPSPRCDAEHPEMHLSWCVLVAGHDDEHYDDAVNARWATDAADGAS